MATQLCAVHRFNVDEYHRMGELRILPQGGVELMEGRIVFAAGRPWRFTVEDYHKLGRAGILGEDDRVELIEGEIIDMAPIGSRHAAHVNRLVALLNERLGGAALLSVQNPLRLSDGTEPLPDVMLLRPRADFYAGAHPTPADVLLLIEVADTSAAFDRTKKAALYAAQAVPEYWLVDTTRGEVVVHTDASGAGYLSVERFGRDDAWTSTKPPSLSVRGSDVLG